MTDPAPKPPEIFIAPGGSELEIPEDDELIYINTDWGYGFGFPRKDFEAFVQYWNERSL